MKSLKFADWIPLAVAMIATGSLLIAGSTYATDGKDSDMEENFCMSCHEMKENVLPDYTKSTHYINRSGVRAECTSCHLPEDFVPMMLRKAQAAREVVQSLRGVLDSPEKFEKERLRMAKSVWAEMEANDSRECRSCHNKQAFDFSKFKKPEDAKRMEKGLSEGQTCINCHKGIVHKLPDMSSGYKAVFDELKSEAADNSLSVKEQYPIKIIPLFKEKNGRPLGKILPATKLNVLEKDGNWVKVSIHGWQQDGVEAMIYEEQGKRIFSAGLSKKIKGDVQTNNTMTDPDTEQVWHEAELTCWVKAADMIPSCAPLWNYGSEMLTSACSTCHSATPPAHFKANQWIGNLKAMKHNLSLSKEEYRFFLKYLQMHASDMDGTH